jgi:hypothetical protein
VQSGRLVGEALVTLGGNPELRRDLAQDLHGEQLARVNFEVAEHLAGVASGLGEPRGRTERMGGIPLHDRLHRVEQQLGIGDPEHREHVGRLDPALAGVGDELLEGAERVPEAAGGVTGDERHRAVVDSDRLLAGDPAEHGRHLLHRRSAEVEPVAAIDDRRQDLLGLGRREHEDRPRRRLLERLQERIPRLGREHVRLVQDVDLVPARNRRVRDFLAEVADVVDGVVRGRVHLDHVERACVRDRDA